MTIIPLDGEKKAAIEYNGNTTLYKIGDKFDLGSEFEYNLTITNATPS